MEKKKEKRENQKSHLEGKTKRKVSTIVGIFLLVAVCGFSVAKKEVNRVHLRKVQKK